MVLRHFGRFYFNISVQISVKAKNSGSDDISTLNFGCCVLMTLFSDNACIVDVLRVQDVKNNFADTVSRGLLSLFHNLGI